MGWECGSIACFSPMKSRLDGLSGLEWIAALIGKSYALRLQRKLNCILSRES